MVAVLENQYCQKHGPRKGDRASPGRASAPGPRGLVQSQIQTPPTNTSRRHRILGPMERSRKHYALFQEISDFQKFQGSPLKRVMQSTSPLWLWCRCLSCRCGSSVLDRPEAGGAPGPCYAYMCTEHVRWVSFRHLRNSSHVLHNHGGVEPSREYPFRE